MKTATPSIDAALFELPKLLQCALLIKCLDYVSPLLSETSDFACDGSFMFGLVLNIINYYQLF